MAFLHSNPFKSCSPRAKKRLDYLPISTKVATFVPMNSMQALNLPPAPLRLSKRDGHTYVFDPLRRRYVRLTPEEWVRQHFVHFLTEHRGYPMGQLQNEVSLSLGQMTKRCDTVLYDHEARPQMIVEYKAPTVAISQRTFDQVSRYNIVMRVPYLIVSNGLQHYCCSIDYEQGTYKFLRDIPEYGNL